MAICNELLEVRVRQRAKLRDVANFCGLTPLDIWEFERGVRRPSDDEIERLSQCFGVQFEDLPSVPEDINLFIRW